MHKKLIFQQNWFSDERIIIIARSLQHSWPKIKDLLTQENIVENILSLISTKHVVDLELGQPAFEQLAPA